MDIQSLKVELTSDPLGRGYSGMTDQQAADDINTIYRTRNRTSMSGSEIFLRTDLTEYVALSDTADDTKKLKWLSFCAIDEHDPFGVSAQFVIQLFGSGSQTVANLQAARIEVVSRGVELGLGRVKPGHVLVARQA